MTRKTVGMDDMLDGSMDPEEHKQMSSYTSSGSSVLVSALYHLAVTQERVGSVMPGWVEGRPNFIRITFLALVDELMELLHHFDWKPWKDPQPQPAKAEMAAEFADVLAFLGYIVIWLDNRGISIRELAEAYEAKTALNIKRLAGQVPGYGIQEEEEI